MHKQSALSLEYVRVPVSARLSGAYINPTTDTVVMAFTAQGVAPVANDWKTAVWETDATTTPSTYRACCLVGPSPGTVTLAAGVFDVWVKVTDNPEAPARKAGNVEIT